MNTRADALRATALAECNHPADQLCEHRTAALSCQLGDQRPRVDFDLGAFGAWLALGIALNLLLILGGVQIWRWLS